MSTSQYLFNDPNVTVSPEGDVLPPQPSDDVPPMARRRADAELRQDHPFDAFTESSLLNSVVEVEEVPTPESEEDALGLKTSNAPTRFHIPAQTRILGFEKVKKVRSEIQQNLEKQQTNNFNGRGPGY